MKRVTKAVFPVGGLGVRFLPATKANPMEMLPIVDKPLIQYAVEEAVAAGITDLIFVNGRNKRAIPDHFDKALELETELRARGSTEMIDLVGNILPPQVNCLYLRQSEALGLGHALLCAEPAVNDEPFMVIMADDLIDADPGVCAQLMAGYDYFRCSLLAVQPPGIDRGSVHGWVETRPCGGRVQQIAAFVECEPAARPVTASGVAGRFLFTSRVFDHLRRARSDAKGSVDLNAAIASLATEQQVLAHEFAGIRYDCGSKLGYMQAVVEYALKRSDLGVDLARYLKGRICGDPAGVGGSAVGPEQNNGPVDPDASGPRP